MTRLTLDGALAAGTYELTPVGVPPLPPDPTPVPGGVLDVFNRLGPPAAPWYVQWRYVMQDGADVRAALIAEMGLNQYDQWINHTSYDSPPCPLVQGNIYWLDPNWTGPPPASILEPGYLHASVV
jgi:hypothetical protein